MNFIERLANKDIYWNIHKDLLPRHLAEYDIQLIVDQVEVNEQIIEKPYLLFRHYKTKKQFQMIFHDSNQPKTCLYLAELDINGQVMQITLQQPIDIIAFSTVKGYTKPQARIEQISQSERDGYETEEDIEMMDWDDFDDSDKNDNSEEDTGVDFSEENAGKVKIQLLKLLKIKEVKHAKVKEIRERLIQCGYRVPHARLQDLLKEVCGDHRYNKKKGYLVKQQYMTAQEREAHRAASNQIIKPEKKKKTSKKPQICKIEAEKQQLTAQQRQQLLKQGKKRKQKGLAPMTKRQQQLIIANVNPPLSKVKR